MSRKSTSRIQSRSDSSRESHLGSSSSQQDGYRFSLVNGQVSNLQEYERGRWKNETIDRNESWAFDGTNLIQQEIKRYGMQTTTYSDPDGDGIFSKGTETFSPATVNLSVSSVF